jgi:GT2 family glycosyltransferase
MHCANIQDFSPHQLSISIVSHGQGNLIKELLEDLMPLIHVGAEVLLTLNIPEDESFAGDFSHYLKITRNKKPLGFGENHNNANSKTDRYWFVVLNPDIRCNPEIFRALIAAHKAAVAGVVAPLIVGVNGNTEDSVRLYPSFMRILVRVLRRTFGLRLAADYQLLDGRPTSVDWAAGMFLLFKSTDFRKVRGFDTNYFMYLEDADICQRLNLMGLPTVVVPDVRAIHYARRASRRNFQHFRWHLSSLLRFLFIARWARRQTPRSNQKII